MTYVEMMWICRNYMLYGKSTTNPQFYDLSASPQQNTPQHLDQWNMLFDLLITYNKSTSRKAVQQVELKLNNYKSES
jgi:hypothetical protein